MNTQTMIETPFGVIHVTASEHYLQGIELFSNDGVVIERPSMTLQKFSRELEDFFIQAHNEWSTPLLYSGTDFQQRVWQYLRAIPIGETRSYSQVAEALNSSARAVGNACHANPFPIVVPCHRVVSKSGLGGFGGKTDGYQLRVKKWLLEHERNR